MNYIRYSTQSGLTDSDIVDMRKEASTEGTSVEVLSSRYGINRTTTARILKGSSWSHVPQPKTLGKYTVYPDGRIYSESAKRFMKTFMRDGEQSVEIRVHGDREIVSVASLVAKAFLGSKAKKFTYKNGDSTDIHFTNLTTQKSK